jgi:hypothetical protein
MTNECTTCLKLCLARALTLHASGVSNVKHENILEEKISEVNDLLPRVPADGWSRFTSGFHNFRIWDFQM